MLEKLEKESIRRKIPILGSFKGKILVEKLKDLKIKNILELGSANGYSGIILSQFGKIKSIEINEKIAEEAKENFKKFNVDGEIIVGDGVSFINNCDEKFDLIFIDFEKRLYIEVLEKCIELSKFIVADNVNFEKCKDFKEKILNDKRLETEIIDDLSFSRKVY